MAKRRQRKERGAIVGYFAWRLVEMLESPAYRALSLSAHRAMARLEIELSRHGSKPEENGRLPCTYQHFIEFGIERHAVGPAIRELVALGFIEITRRGCAGNAGFRLPTLYRLTYRHCGSHRETTDEWRRIKTEEEAMAIAKRARSALAGRRPKIKVPCGKPSLAPVRETPTEKEHSPVRETPTTAPVRETPTTSIPLRGTPTSEQDCDGPHALIAKLPWSPPRVVEIKPEIDLALNWAIGDPTSPLSTAYRRAPIDALTALEGLILSKTLREGTIH